jgi:hypothetical protein
MYFDNSVGNHSIIALIFNYQFMKSAHWAETFFCMEMNYLELLHSDVENLRKGDSLGDIPQYWTLR